MPEEVEGGLRKTFAELNPQEDEEHNDRLLQGLILAESDIEHYDTSAEIECPKCHSKATPTCISKDFRQFKIPEKCTDCNVDVKINKINRGRLRKILVQENIQSKPQELTTFLFGDDVLKADAGDKVDIRGQLRSVKKHQKDKTYQRVFDVNQMRKTENKIEAPTLEEIKNFKAITNQELIDSFAPNIVDMDMVKEGLLISLIGGVNTDDVIGDINTLLVGDPGTAKTKLLQFCVKISSPSAYASGRSASAAGLLAGVDNLSDGTRVARAGVVTLCNGGVVALDEMDKMSNSDRTALHESMSTQHFSLIKIGINRTWEVKTVIIGAANPYGGNKYDTKISIKDNIRLSDSLLSRFCLIFLVLDEPDLEKDLLVARHILKARQQKIESPLTIEQLTKYINHAKTFNPILNDEAGEYLLKWWSELRQESQPDKSPAVDHRVMEDLNRITEAYARKRFCNEANIDDAKNAVELLTTSLHTMKMNTPGERAESSTRGMNKEQLILHVFEKPVTENQAIIELCKRRNHFKSKHDAKKCIEELKAQTHLTEGMKGELVWVN